MRAYIFLILVNSFLFLFVSPIYANQLYKTKDDDKPFKEKQTVELNFENGLIINDIPFDESFLLRLNFGQNCSTKYGNIKRVEFSYRIKPEIKYVLKKKYGFFNYTYDIENNKSKMPDELIKMLNGPYIVEEENDSQIVFKLEENFYKEIEKDKFIQNPAIQIPVFNENSNFKWKIINIDLLHKNYFTSVYNEKQSTIPIANEKSVFNLDTIFLSPKKWYYYPSIDEIDFETKYTKIQYINNYNNNTCNFTFDVGPLHPNVKYEFKIKVYVNNSYLTSNQELIGTRFRDFLIEYIYINNSEDIYYAKSYSDLTSDSRDNINKQYKYLIDLFTNDLDGKLYDENQKLYSYKSIENNVVVPINELLKKKEIRSYKIDKILEYEDAIISIFQSLLGEKNTSRLYDLIHDNRITFHKTNPNSTKIDINKDFFDQEKLLISLQNEDLNKLEKFKNDYTSILDVLSKSKIKINRNDKDLSNIEGLKSVSAHFEIKIDEIIESHKKINELIDDTTELQRQINQFFLKNLNIDPAIASLTHKNKLNNIYGLLEKILTRELILVKQDKNWSKKNDKSLNLSNDFSFFDFAAYLFNYKESKIILGILKGNYKIVIKENIISHEKTSSIDKFSIELLKIFFYEISELEFENASGKRIFTASEYNAIESSLKEIEKKSNINFKSLDLRKQKVIDNILKLHEYLIENVVNRIVYKDDILKDLISKNSNKLTSINGLLEISQEYDPDNILKNISIYRFQSIVKRYNKVLIDGTVIENFQDGNINNINLLKSIYSIFYKDAKDQSKKDIGSILEYFKLILALENELTTDYSKTKNEFYYGSDGLKPDFNKILFPGTSILHSYSFQSSSVLNVVSKNNPYVGLNIGLMYGFGDFNSFFIIESFNFYLKPVNKNTPLSYYKNRDQLYKRIYGSIGIAQNLNTNFSNNYSELVDKDNAINGSLYLGLGARFSRVFCFNAGVCFFENNQNTQLLLSEIGWLGLFGVSMDINIFKALKSTSDNVLNIFK